jgi:hypothetical protein
MRGMRDTIATIAAGLLIAASLGACGGQGPEQPPLRHESAVPVPLDSVSSAPPARGAYAQIRRSLADR